LQDIPEYENTTQAIDQRIFNNPNDELFTAIAWSDRAAVKDDYESMIRKAVENGADLDGTFAIGETPLTEAIMGGIGSPLAVKKLLELLGARSKRSANGWSPWAVCLLRFEDPAVSDRMEKIMALLSKYDTDTSDEQRIELRGAVLSQQIDQVKHFINTGADLNSPVASALPLAVLNGALKTVKLLLSSGADPEEPLNRA
jgi:hypothetical protein